MPPKRKSEALEPDDDFLRSDVSSETEAQNELLASVFPSLRRAKNAKEAKKAQEAKKARKADVGEGSSSGVKKDDAVPEAPKKWHEIVLEGEEEGDLKIFDDCNDIRRKIRALQKQPDFKVTHWLKEIGNINNNSYGRFMKATGPSGGASNGTYYAAYVYFEKVRIAEGKKKTAKRVRNEQEYLSGMPTEERRGVWVRA